MAAQVGLCSRLSRDRPGPLVRAHCGERETPAGTTGLPGGTRAADTIDVPTHAALASLTSDRRLSGRRPMNRTCVFHTRDAWSGGALWHNTTECRIPLPRVHRFGAPNPSTVRTSA